MTLSPTNTTTGRGSGSVTNVNIKDNGIPTSHFFNYSLENTSTSSDQIKSFHPHHKHTHSHSHTRVIIIPTLDDLISGDRNEDENNGDDYYSEGEFIKYLESIHCIENYQFIIDINKLIEQYHEMKLLEWQVFFNQFLNMNSIQEINIGCNLKSKFNYFEIPTLHLLVHIKKIIMDEILINLFNEFIKFKNYHIKLINKNGGDEHDQLIIYRRKSELVSPIDKTSHIPYPDEPILGQLDEEESLSNQIDNKLFISKSTIKQIELNDIDDNSSSNSSNDSSLDNDSYLISSRNNSSASTTTTVSNSGVPGSRGSSIGSIIDSIEKFKKVKKQFKFRRFSNEE
ncbi:hypothetical protein DFJ63DRAFT_333959 [Scheffersomyces coipomensis]|uniref:uncharacterized protein n=1 Tax=Scheffersomyces coipomensis TaxID=1788519 RepID=UPI00315C7C48